MKEQEKEQLRQRVWEKLEESDIARFPRPCFGRIPNFEGSKQAAQLLLRIPQWHAARCVFSAPDQVLNPLRRLVLERGKTLAVALPHMRGFLEIGNPGNISAAITIKGFKKYGVPLRSKVDIFVQGAVAVDRKGNRLGKGAGYGDQEWEWLKKHQLLATNAIAVTVVHPLQIVEDLSPLMHAHDVRVHYLLTPEEVITAE